jgi:ubiquinone/menaquinone biosynthesis C-methylase UbiE
MSTAFYPLGHKPEELDRLNMQAQLLFDPLLAELASKATSCLEIGCGNGANLPALRKANPNLRYLGIDRGNDAVVAASARFREDQLAEFRVMDGTRISFDQPQFDMVFTKLVLWAAGKACVEVLAEAYRVLLPGGVFYAMEPCNHLILLEPEKPSVRKWIQLWDQGAYHQGLDPSVGTKVPALLKRSGFQGVQAKFFPIIAFGDDRQKYKAVIANMKGFLMGAAIESFGLYDLDLKQKAVEEFDQDDPYAMIADALFVSWGTKS